MTPEEREKMNLLCARIQEEKDYEKFAAAIRDLSELIGRKEHRFLDRPYDLIWQRNRPWKTVPATVKSIVKSHYPAETEKVEISVTVADPLFREIRIDNALTDVDGRTVALKQGAHVDVTFEADAGVTEKANLKPGL